MSDTERVYALFVQVNPVPEPDLLPPTRDEAQLPTYEGSRFMDTLERTEVRTPERIRRRKPAAVFAAAFLVILAVAGGVFLLSGGEDSGPVAAADARPVITCDGVSCTYDGPTQIHQGVVEFTVVNSGQREITFTVWKIDADAIDAELERTPVGTDMALAPDDPLPEGDLMTTRSVPAGQTAAIKWGFVAETVAGSPTGALHLVDVVTRSGESEDHAWRVAAIEVVDSP